MDILLQTYYTLLPIVTTAFIGWVGMVLKNQKTKEQERDEQIIEKEKEALRVRKANSEGIKLILRYMLKRYHSEYMLQGKMTYSQYKDWMDIYSAYSALHGNSIATDWNADIEALPKCESMSDMSPFEAMLRRSLEQEESKES